MTRALFVAALLGPLAFAPALAAPEKPEASPRNGAAKPAPARPADARPAALKPEEGKPAPARGAPALPGGESREPITIDADSLEWFDKEQKAIYTGNVVARQGEATLKATQLRIFMRKPDKAGAPDDPAPATAGPGVAGDNQIERMEADGPVELIQKDQTATGDRGVYERGGNAVTLIGNVSLRQGGHITLGDRLVYDLDSRQAVIQKPRGTFAPRNQPAAAPKR